VTSTAASTPFSNKFTANGACELITFQFFNREERGAAASLGDFSPSLPGVSDALCWESTVLSIRNGASHMPTTTDSGVLGSKNSQPVNITSGFQNGWAQLTFAGTNATTLGLTSLGGAGISNAINVNTGVSTTVAQNYRGLPVIGFMVRTLFNGTLTCTSVSGGASSACQGSYGSLFDHKYVATITPAP